MFLSPADGGSTASEQEGSGLEQILRLWSESSRTLQQLQSASGGLYLHFVQPNQYYPAGRTFAAAERAVALSADSVYAEPIRRGYPRLDQALVELRGQGVALYSLLHLFDGTPGQVYADDCCHYTNLGQRLMAEAIARVAAQALERRQRLAS